MARKPIDPSDPDKLQIYVPVMFSRRDVEVIDRVAAAYGMSRAGAVRLMSRHGFTRYDPYSTDEGE